MREWSVREGVARVRERIAEAAHRSGRDPGRVAVVAVTKGVTLEAIAEAAEAGITDFGENRANELDHKARALDPVLRWHFVGQLQTNKVRYLDRVHVVHGLDRAREAGALQGRGEQTSRSWDVLVQVNIAAERRKGGLRPEDVERFLEELQGYSLVRPRGLMFVAPQVENAEDVRAMFAEARGLRDRYVRFGIDELSMGMSDDYEVAVEEGSTIVRIGRAIFGAWPPRMKGT